MPILGYFDIFDIFGPLFVNFEPKKISKFQKKCVENLKNFKNWAKNADFSLFWTKN